MSTATAPTSPAAPTAWSARPEVKAITSDRLAALVSRAADRAGRVLFTATPADELDAIGSWQRLMDLAWAGQVRAVQEASDRATEAERAFLPDEIALALGVAVRTGQAVAGEALRATELPGLVEAVEEGVLTVRHVRAVLDVLCTADLTLHQQQLLVLLALARFTGQTPGELRRLVERLVLSVDLTAAEARKRVKDRQRSVRFQALGDDQASVTATGPIAMIEMIRASLEATLPLGREDGDERSKDAREFDLLVDLLTGSATPGSWTASVVVPFSTAAGGEWELAEIPGLGPVLPSTARELLDEAGQVLRVSVDEVGSVLAVDRPALCPRPSVPVEDAPRSADRAAVRETDNGSASSSGTCPVSSTLRLDLPGLLAFTAAPVVSSLSTPAYRIPSRIRRFVQARDRTCTFPGCTRTAVTSDVDHRRPWPLGETSDVNLHCLCRRHHRAKQAAFAVHLTTDSSTVWTTRGGWQFTRRPQRW